MSIRKPSTFPIRPVLDGSEEIYTQTNGVSEKFTLGSLASAITQYADIWLYKEIFISASDMGGSSVTPVRILDEADLNTNEYFEINRVIFESTFNTQPMTTNGVVDLIYKPSIGAPVVPTDSFYIIPQSFLETAQDSVLCFYSPFTSNPFRRNHGLYLASRTVPPKGDTSYFLKIYYKIAN